VINIYSYYNTNDVGNDWEKALSKYWEKKNSLKSVLRLILPYEAHRDKYNSLV